MSGGLRNIYCGLNTGVPDFYSRVTKYLPWIDTHTRDASEVITKLGDEVQLKCMSDRNKNYDGCFFFNPKKVQDIIHLFDDNKRYQATYDLIMVNGFDS